MSIPTHDKIDIAVVGAGAAGLLAAARASQLGRRCVLLEKNRQAGVKILMSGGTRCNLTHATDHRGIIDAFGDQGPFLHSPLAALSPDDLVQLIEAEGVKTKVEPGGKVFPESDKAADVLAALLRRLARSRATLALDEPVLDVRRTDTGFELTTARRIIRAGKLIVTTGGQSYPGCGTSGDGYGWLERLGHTIVPLRPALTPLKTRCDWAKSLRGVAVKDTIVRVVQRDAGPGFPRADTGQRRRLPAGAIAERRGAMLFAHFGLSGPAVLDVSRIVAQHRRPRWLVLVCDFLPSENSESLAAHWQQLAASDGKQHLATPLRTRLPRRLVDALLDQAGLPPDRRLAELTRPERTALIRALKETRIPVTGTLGFPKAEVTAGGVALGEVDSRSMQSKLVANLFVAGEILDLDGPIGGYNFQAAFSTGWLAGESAAA
jgi:predicted flavoprotein YhiN